MKYTVIKSRRQYNEYCRLVDKFLELDHISKAQDDEIQLLTVLIEKWDADHSYFKDLDPVEIIQSLMKDHELTATSLADILDISKSYVSEIVNYKKGLSKEVIRKLSGHFKLNQEAFNRPYTLKQSVDTVASRKLNTSIKALRVT